MKKRDAVDTARDILFKMVEDNIDIFRKSEGYDNLNSSYFSAFSYNSILGSAKEDLARINHMISIYRKAKEDNNKILLNTAIVTIGMRISSASYSILDLWFCISRMDLLPFWIEPSDEYIIPQEYFQDLQGKEIANQIYKDVFSGENMFDYIQSELAQLFKQTRLEINIIKNDSSAYRSENEMKSILLSYRGDDKIDEYIKKNFETLINFSDIFNRASVNNDALCMCMALGYMKDSLEALDKTFYLLEADVCRIRYSTKRLKYIDDIIELEKLLKKYYK
jgi:tRNA threonylcarbamoyladenosine modification (KEOPS) complex  Pcc1 subunit